SEEVEEGLVIKTDPEANRSVKEKSTVNVFVSEGKEKVKFGDYVGENFGQTKRLLEEEGYKDVIDYHKPSDEPEGDIISQTEPKVIFEVSSGPETFTLMRLTGLSLDEAKEYANENGLTLDVSEEHSDSVEKGNIISQSPEANTEVVAGTEVEVVQSLGKKEQPPKSHNVSFTVPYEPDEKDDEKDDANNNDASENNDESDGQEVQIY